MGLQKSQEVVKAAERLYLQGIGPSAICKKVGIAYPTLADWIAKYGWKEKKEKVELRVANRVVAEVVAQEADRKAAAVTELRALRKAALLGLLPTLDEEGNVVPALRPKSFGEMSSTVMGTISSEADLLGWKVLPPQVVQVVIDERESVAKEMVKLAMEVLLSAIPEDKRAQVLSTFKSRVAEIEAKIQEPPTLALGVGQRG